MFELVLRGGPVDGYQSGVAAPRVPARLYFGEVPEGMTQQSFAHNGFMLVAWDQPPEYAWPGQIAYVLDTDASDLRPHPDYDDMATGTAIYRPEQPATTEREGMT